MFKKNQPPCCTSTIFKRTTLGTLAGCTSTLAAASLALASATVSQAAEASLTLATTQQLALNQNRDIKQAALEVSKSEASLKSIIATRYPKLSAIVFWGQQVNRPFPENLAVLPGIFQPVTQQYRLDLQVQEANLAVKLAREQLRLTRQHTIAEIKKVFLTMVALKSAINARENNLRFLQQLSEYIDAEIKRGQALPVSGQVVHARLARTEYELERDRDDLITIGQRLNRLLGRPLRMAVEVEAPVDSEPQNLDENAVITAALAQRPELNKTRLTERQYVLHKKIELSRYIPDVSVGVTGTYSRHLDITLPKSFTAVGFLASWEPWDWGRKIQLSRVASEQVKQTQLALSDLSDSVSVEADNARRAIKVAAKEVEAGGLSESSSKEELRVTYKRYQAGSALLKDVMEAQATYSKSISENVKAKTDYASAVVELDRALGKDLN